jgi:O-antigen/teichoic acid export membrane protein
MSNYVSTGLTFPVMQVVYVGFARVKDKPAELGRLFIATLENLTGVLWPAYALIALLARPMIYVLYGPRWLAAAPLLSLVCLGGILLTVYGVHARVLTALGRVGTIFAIECLVMCVRIVAALALARYGVFFAVLGVVAPSLIALPLYWWAVWPHIVMRRPDLVALFGRSLAVTLATLAIPLLIMMTQALAQAPQLAQFLSCLLAGGLGWLLGIRLCGHRLKGEIAGAWQHGIFLFKRVPGLTPETAPIPTVTRDLAP